MSQQRALDTSAPINAPDYDLFDLIGLAVATGTPVTPGTTPTSTPTGVAPLTWEGLVVATIPFVVVCTDNYVESLENFTISNTGTVAAVVSIQQFEYTATGAASPYGLAGPVIYSATVAAGANLTADNTKTRLTCTPGLFLAMFATSVGTPNVNFQGRTRFTPG